MFGGQCWKLSIKHLNMKHLIKLILLQTLVPLSMGAGLALAAFGRRKRRSLEAERIKAADNLLDMAKVTLENNIESFLKKMSSMHLE